VAPLALWAIVRAFGLDRTSDFASVMVLTPYVTIGAFLLLGLCIAWRNWAASAVAGIAFLVLSTSVLPRAFGAGEEVPTGSVTLTVLSANVHAGAADPDALVGLVRRLRPDVLAVQELAPPFARRLRSAGLDRYLPRAVLQFPLPGEPKRRPGIGTYSRFALRRLAGDATSSSRVAVSLPGGHALRLVDFHPLKPLSDPERWRNSLQRLPSAGTGTPWLVAGDFNATLDEAALRDVVDHGYRDAAEVVGKGLEPTWPDNRLLSPLITVDHVLADRRIGIAAYGVEDLPGTDHRAIYARLFLARPR
jgi:endonuclease/exonuclease/phosphatase (EEP) superfamily protein YafD